MGARKPKPVVVETRSSKTPFTPAFVGGVFGAVVLTIVGTVVIGKLDSGQINVNATIQTANDERVAAGGEPAVPMVREDLRNKQNGGLVPAENQSAPEAQPLEQVSTPAEQEGETASTSPEENSEESAKEEEQVEGAASTDTVTTESVTEAPAQENGTQ